MTGDAYSFYRSKTSQIFLKGLLLTFERRGEENFICESQNKPLMKKGKSEPRGLLRSLLGEIEEFQRIMAG